jgi:hypothetical protein
VENKKIIGRTEKVDLPEWKLFKVPAKVDTGAYSCAIHCEDIYVQNEAGGKQVLYFTLLDRGQPLYHGQRFQTSDFRKKKVTSSTGDTQERYLVRARVRLFGVEYEADFTLTDRKTMRFPILLGRKLLKGKFLVDVDQKNMSKKFLLQNKS